MPRPTTFSYIGSQAQFDDFSPIPSPGGRVHQFTAGGSLNIGDVVQMSGTATVNKATANPTKIVGVVVGGTLLPNYIFEHGGATIATLLATPIPAATVGQLVYVMTLGIFYVVADGAIANGALIKQSGTTAGYVTTATADTDAGAVIGKLIDVASVNSGDIRLALISLM